MTIEAEAYFFGKRANFLDRTLPIGTKMEIEPLESLYDIFTDTNDFNQKVKRLFERNSSFIEVVTPNQIGMHFPEGVDFPKNADINDFEIICTSLIPFLKYRINWTQ